MIEHLGFKVGDFFFVALSSIILFFKPMYYSLGFLLIFILLDMVSGLALMHHNKEKFCWTKFWTTFRKMVYFMIVVISGFIFDFVFIKPFWDFGLFYYMFVMFLAMAEFKSILNNFGKILKIDFWNYFIKSFKNKQLDEIIE